MEVSSALRSQRGPPFGYFPPPRDPFKVVPRRFDHDSYESELLYRCCDLNSQSQTSQSVTDSGLGQSVLQQRSQLPRQKSARVRPGQLLTETGVQATQITMLQRIPGSNEYIEVPIQGPNAPGNFRALRGIRGVGKAPLEADGFVNIPKVSLGSVSDQGLVGTVSDISASNSSEVLLSAPNSVLRMRPPKSYFRVPSASSRIQGMQGSGSQWSSYRMGQLEKLGEKDAKLRDLEMLAAHRDERGLPTSFVVGTSSNIGIQNLMQELKTARSAAPAPFSPARYGYDPYQSNENQLSVNGMSFRRLVPKSAPTRRAGPGAPGLNFGLCGKQMVLHAPFAKGYGTAMGPEDSQSVLTNELAQPTIPGGVNPHAIARVRSPFARSQAALGYVRRAVDQSRMFLKNAKQSLAHTYYPNIFPASVGLVTSQNIAYQAQPKPDFGSLAPTEVPASSVAAQGQYFARRPVSASSVRSRAKTPTPPKTKDAQDLDQLRRAKSSLGFFEPPTRPYLASELLEPQPFEYSLEATTLHSSLATLSAEAAALAASQTSQFSQLEAREQNMGRSSSRVGALSELKTFEMPAGRMQQFSQEPEKKSRIRPKTAPARTEKPFDISNFTQARAAELAFGAQEVNQGIPSGQASGQSSTESQAGKEIEREKDVSTYDVQVEYERLLSQQKLAQQKPRAKSARYSRERPKSAKELEGSERPKSAVKQTEGSETGTEGAPHSEEQHQLHKFEGQGERSRSVSPSPERRSKSAIPFLHTGAEGELEEEDSQEMYQRSKSAVPPRIEGPGSSESKEQRLRPSTSRPSTSRGRIVPITTITFPTTKDESGPGQGFGTREKPYVHRFDEQEYQNALKKHGWRMEVHNDPLFLKRQVIQRRLAYTFALSAPDALPQPPRMHFENRDTFFLNTQPPAKLGTFTIAPDFSSEEFCKRRDRQRAAGKWNYANKAFSFLY